MAAHVHGERPARRQGHARRAARFAPVVGLEPEKHIAGVAVHHRAGVGTRMIGQPSVNAVCRDMMRGQEAVLHHGPRQGREGLAIVAGIDGARPASILEHQHARTLHLHEKEVLRPHPGQSVRGGREVNVRPIGAGQTYASIWRGSLVA